MRKLIVLICSILLSIGILAGCGEVDETKLVKDSISDMTEDVLAAQNADFDVEIVVGYREAPYAIDGVANPTNRIFMIKASPKAEMTEEYVEYSFAAGGETYSGQMPRSRYRAAYTIDLKKAIPCGKGVKLTLKWGEGKTVELDCASVIGEGMVTADAAVNIAMEKQKERIASMMEDKAFRGELSVRLINDKAAEGRKYFWYVAIIKDKTDMASMLIDAATGEIVAERSSSN